MGRTRARLHWGQGGGQIKGSTGSSGPAAPDRSRCRFASGQDGGPEPRLQPETAPVKGRRAGPRGVGKLRMQGWEGG